MKKILVSIIAAAISLSSLSYFAWNNFSFSNTNEWSAEELRLIQSLSLAELPALSIDPSNRLANDSRALDLGYRLFFDTRLSSNSQVSCSSCHRPELMFTDGLPLAIGIDIGPRHTPSLVGTAYSPWFYWDGRKDSQWAQALAPLEARHEHESDRVSIIRLLAEDALLKNSYESAFGSLPVLESLPDSASPLGTDAQQQAWQDIESNQQAAISGAFANVGKALAAYQRLILPGRTRFDRYAAELAADKEMGETETLNSIEIAGLKLFIGQGQCIICHNRWPTAAHGKV
jgi:cytochrome c peroxidase